MPEQISETDYVFLHKLSSLYHALTSAATDPVGVPSDLSIENLVGEKGIYSSQFYDTTEEEGRGTRVMAARITNSAKDIRNHLEMHKRMLSLVNTIEESLNVNNRQRVRKAVNYLCGELNEYDLLVSRHKDKAFDVHRLNDPKFDFLSWPRCPKGHYFILQGYNVIAECSFNDPCNSAGLQTELDILRTRSTDFLIGKGVTSGVRLSDSIDTGEGISDTSYRGRLALNVELLKRAGFDLEAN